MDLEIPAGKSCPVVRLANFDDCGFLILQKTKGTASIRSSEKGTNVSITSFRCNWRYGLSEASVLDNSVKQLFERSYPKEGSVAFPSQVLL